MEAIKNGSYRDQFPRLMEAVTDGSRYISHSLTAEIEVQRISRSQSFWNWAQGKGLVNMSAIYSFVEMCSMEWSCWSHDIESDVNGPRDVLCEVAYDDS